MERSPWWHAAVYSVAAIVSVLVVVMEPSAVGRAGAIGAAGVFALGWASVGRRAWTSQRAGVVYAVVVVLSAGVGTSFSPNFAFIQVIAFPLIWSLTPSFRAAIGANIALAGAVAVGLIVNNGTSPGSITLAVVTELGSLAFSLAFGLWIGSISTRSDERKRLLDELQATQQQLAAANRDVGVTEERERLAREIHDTIAQDLTGLVMLTQRTRREVASGDRGAIDEALDLLESSARATLAGTRGLVAASASVGIEPGGLPQALARLAERFTRETGVAVQVDAASACPLGRDVEVVLLRIAQEGLANVRKHSRASSATLRFERMTGAVRLSLADDGVGFDLGGRSHGFGLSGMRDRLALVGGSFEVHSREGSGTTIAATLPLVDDLTADVARPRQGAVS